MTTNLYIGRRPMAAGNPASWRPSAGYQGAAAKGVACTSPSHVNPGGGFKHERAFRLEGVLRIDRRQNQS